MIVDINALLYLMIFAMLFFCSGLIVGYVIRLWVYGVNEKGW